MELYKLLQVLNNDPCWAMRSVREIQFKMGDKTLAFNRLEMTPNGKMLTIHLHSDSVKPPKGVSPDFKIDKKSHKSQMQAIKEWLLSGKTLTPLEALENFGCFRLSAHIFNLKKEGFEIDNLKLVDERTGKRYATYILRNKPK